jgi:uncharacterized membrane protein
MRAHIFILVLKLTMLFFMVSVHVGKMCMHMHSTLCLSCISQQKDVIKFVLTNNMCGNFSEKGVVIKSKVDGHV